METITNAATAVTSTVSGLIYGQPAKEGENKTTSTNETGGKEPLSGAQGKGTVSEPFDKGNAETPGVDTASSTKQDDEFLKLNPTLGKPTTDTSSVANTSSTGESAIPVIPLNPDASTSNTHGASSATGVTDKVWKPTELDDVSRAGAPGAGPTAPDYKPATGDTSLSASDKPTESATTTSDSSTPKKDNAGVENPHSDSAKAQPTVGGPIEELLNKGTSPKVEHTVDDSEANDPHSKMNDKTVRATDAQKTGDGATVQSHQAEKTTSHASESSKTVESPSPSGEEKSEKKMDKLKDKLKNKLHIGSKDK